MPLARADPCARTRPPASSGLDEGGEPSDELPGALVDLVADGPDRLDGLASGIGEVPVDADYLRHNGFTVEMITLADLDTVRAGAPRA